MAVAEYPMDSVNAAYPRPQEFYVIPERFAGASVTFDDGAKDAAMQHGGNGVRGWRLVYRGLTAVQVAIIVSHFLSAKWLEDESMSAYAFNFRERSDIGSTLYAGVRYTKFETSHTRTWNHSVECELTRFP